MITMRVAKNIAGHNFFLFLQYSNIHTKISEEVLKVFNNFSKEYFENRKLNEQRYDKQFKKAENYLMNILEKITLLDLNKNSIILIMSDHGISVGEKTGERAYGAFCYDYTLRTFAYFIIPGFSPLEISQQVRTVDFMPPNTKSVRTSKWKLIINEYNNSKELYNLESDPDENENLIDKNLEIQETLWKKFLEIQSKANN